jgi:hypothetical protein
MIRLTIGKIWELPQVILAFLLKIMFIFPGATLQKFKYKGITYRIANNNVPLLGGVSLGTDVFLSSVYFGRNDLEIVIKHEYGHTRQSLFLGPLYLIVVGVPSFFRAMTIRDKIKYYKGYPEKWADKLGGVIR